MADANKTAETRQITELCAVWLGERGFRPVETEVPISQKWIADLAGVGSLSRTDALKLKLIPQRPAYSTVAYEENRDLYAIWNERFRIIPQPVTVAIEVKTTKSDFDRDDKWHRSPKTHLLYVAAPSSLLKRIDVPENVGILSHGQNLRMLRPAKLREITESQQANVIYQIAIRRDNFTRYERFRELSRQARENNNERANLARLKSLVYICKDVISGKKTPEEACASYRVKTGNMGNWFLREMESLMPTVVQGVGQLDELERRPSDGKTSND